MEFCPQNGTGFSPEYSCVGFLREDHRGGKRRDVRYFYSRSDSPGLTPLPFETRRRAEGRQRATPAKPETRRRKSFSGSRFCLGKTSAAVELGWQTQLERASRAPDRREGGLIVLSGASPLRGFRTESS